MKTVIAIAMGLLLSFASYGAASSQSLQSLQYMGKTCFFDNFMISHFSNGVHVVIWGNDAVLDTGAVNQLIHALDNPKPTVVKGKYSYDLQLKPFGKGGYRVELKSTYKNVGNRVLLTEQDIKYVKSCLVVKER